MTKVKHEIYLVCDDVEVFVGEMRAQNLTCPALEPADRLCDPEASRDECNEDAQ